MATIGFRANEGDLHDDLDINFSDFDFDVPEPKDDRHPIVRALSPVGRGAKDYITNSSNIKRFVRAALPPGYGQAADLVGNVRDEMKQLYNNATKEMRPVKETAKNFTRKALPALDGKIPKGLKKKLEELTKEEEQWNSRHGDGREEQLGALLTSIFEQKEKDKISDREEYVDREKINQAFDQIRHREEINQLDAIRVAAQAQAQYQNTVTFPFQKKQLELGYRMFWAIADLNKEQKRSNAMLLSEMKATRINTALPDYVKQTFHERIKETLRNKFLEKGASGMFGGTQDYVRQFVRNLGNEAMNKIRPYAQTADAVGGMADTAMDTAQGFGDMPGVNMKDEVISMLMSFPLDLLSEKGSQSLAKILGKSSKIRRGGAAASRFVNTAGDRIREHLTSSNNNWGMLEGMREMLARAAPSTLSDSKMEVDGLDKMHLPSPFNRSNAKTLNEVIPGLLSRIWQEVRILRTGDEKTGLIAYDYSKNRFTTDKQLGKDLRQRIAGNHTANANSYAESILNNVELCC